MQIPTTWIVIADGAKASVFEYLGLNQGLVPVPGAQFTHKNEPTRKLVTSDRGRVFQSADGTRSAMEYPTDPHQHEKNLFAAEIANYLNDNIEKYDRLIITSSPKMLGTIRQHITSQTQDKIMAEIDKDLTKIPPSELPNHFQDIINI